MVGMIKLYIAIFLLIITHCSSITKNAIPIGQAYLCITVERKDGEIPLSQKEFQKVAILSGTVLIYSNRQENDCYFFDTLPANKVYSPYLVENTEVVGNWYQWKNDGYRSRGLYGKFDKSKTRKYTVSEREKVFLGRYKLIVTFSEDEREASLYRYAGSHATGRLIIKNAEYEIREIE